MLLIKDVIKTAAKLFSCGFPIGDDDELDSLVSEYIETVVKVDPDLMEKHKKLIHRVISLLENALQSPKAKQLLGGIKFKFLLKSGSSFENLKVRDADEFDIMIVFEPDNDVSNPWQMKILNEECLNTGYVNFDVVRRKTELECHNMKPFLKPELHNKALLDTINPQKVYETVERLITEVLNDTKSTFGYHSDPLELDLHELELAKSSRSGPAVTITVKDAQTGRTMSLDLVATLALPNTDKLLVPKEKHWRQSYALEEKKLMEEIERYNPEMVDVFRVVKAKSSKDYKTSPLCMLDSYTFKNAILKLYHENPNLSGLSTIFKAYLYLLENAFLEGNLPRYFEPSCNLTDRFKREKLIFLAQYLSNIRTQDGYFSFVKLDQLLDSSSLKLTLNKFHQEINNNNNNDSNHELMQINLQNNIKNYLRNVSSRVGYKFVDVYINGMEILIVFQLDTEFFLPIPVNCKDLCNFTQFKITDKNSNEMISGKNLLEIVEKEVKIAENIPVGFEIIPAFSFRGHKEIDPNLIFRLVSGDIFKIEIDLELTRMVNSLDIVDDGIRLKVLRELIRVGSKTGFNLDKLLITALMNNADDFRFSHSGCENIMLDNVVSYVARCLDEGAMYSPVDNATNVLADYKDSIEKLKTIFTLDAVKFNSLRFEV